MRVLIVKVSALGDVVHSLPVLNAIRSACPDAEIDWLVEESFAPLLAGHPLLHQVLELRSKYWRTLPWFKMLPAFGRFVRVLRRRRYDLVFDLQGNSKSGLLTLLSRGTDKYGFDRHQVREWPNLLATRHHVPLEAAHQHVSARAVAVVRAALPHSIAPVDEPLLAVDAHARQRVEQQLQRLQLDQRPLVVLHYGTTWPTKLWSLECWQQLAVQLVDAGAVQPLLTWGNEQERLAASAISQATAGRAILWPRGTLPELVALLARVQLVVGCDTGPVHIAAALGTPTVSIFRVTDAQRNGPRGERHRCLQSALPCAKCLRKHCEKDALCATSISVEQVGAAMAEVLELPKGGL